ncbi:MAG TPA: leucine--tRNA ligase [Candidatus Limnocylindria bacterium]|nr:leucine--tRNA ligase [Candidatus Limnocylindria bacterium]
MTERAERFDPRTYEAGWRERWEADDLYRADDEDPRDKHYLLTMYPYPSGDLHIGHWYAATGPDIVARMRRMQGLNVMFPMGFDSFGLPAENAAIDRGVHPAEWTEQNIERMRIQFRSMGCMFDWSREVVSSDPAYYRWTQWLFLQFFKAGLAYKQMAAVDWCPKDQVVLAREQVEGADRHCWRCGTPVVKRELEQWFLRVTRYADELLDFSGIDWPEPIRLMQTNWIGRSEGAEVDFAVEADGAEPIRVFTTRPDTIFGATFMVLAPEHASVAALTSDERRAEVEAYAAAARRETEIERMGAERERNGVFIGAHAINPMTEERIPIWIADYVLPGYGTGAVMGVPAHDDRDYDFAKRYQLPIRYVIMPRGGEVPSEGAFLPHTDDEVLIDSGDFTGMAASDAIPAITEELAERGQGEAAISYKIRDWLISRQRYWGAPIPIVYCDEHGPQPLPEDQLPVLLPRDVDFAPTGVSPLQSHAEFLAASCPVCAGPARRETDTLDTFVDSSWYFLRYTSPHEETQAWDPVALMRWMPVDLYTGGAEHAVLHLMYSRFFIKALRDMHHLDFDEPFRALRNQGQILGADHHRMSKSRGNVVNPDDLTSRFGSDTVRCFLMFIGPWDQGGPWNPSSIEGVHRFLGRVWAVAQAGGSGGDEAASRSLRQAAHRAIKEVGEDYGEFHFNTALSKLMELTNALGSARDDGLAGTDAYAEAVDTLLLLLAPMAPHISEELWSRRGKPYSIHQQTWPEFDLALVASDMIELPVQVDGKLRDRLVVAPGTAAEEIERLALASERVQGYLKGRAPRKVVQIPGRLVNIVTPGE